MTTDHDRNAIDLTQLSSREQLSALMDSALPPDQTRFLLRRLRHDEALAASWERWRLAGEVMRGLAPAQRLPADFAARVAASLHGPQAISAAPMQVRAQRPRWLQWSGGAAIAASLAVAALILPRPEGSAEVGPSVAVQQVPAADLPVAGTTASIETVAAVPAPADVGGEAVAAALAAAAVVRPVRERAATRAPVAAEQAAHVAQADSAQPAAAALVPQPDIVTRPWPRSVLPQYADSGLTVGFGDPARGAAPYNPFQAQARFDELPAPAAPDAEVPPAAQPPAQP
jgi:negative regulator of sigma E activity